MGKGTMRISEQLLLEVLHLRNEGVGIQKAEVVIDVNGRAYLDLTLEGESVPDGPTEVIFTRIPESVTVRFEKRPVD